MIALIPAIIAELNILNWPVTLNKRKSGTSRWNSCLQVSFIPYQWRINLPNLEIELSSLEASCTRGLRASVIH